MRLSIDNCFVFQKRIYDEHGSTRSTIPGLFERKSCRAFRLVGDSTRFLYVTFSKNTGRGQVAIALQEMVDNGVKVRDDLPPYVLHDFYSAISDKLHLRYKFLGFTEANLKTGQIIFFCEGEDWDCQRLLKAFGNLEEVYLQHGAGTYAARLSLSFSATVDTVAVCDRECPVSSSFHDLFRTRFLRMKPCSSPIKRLWTGHPSIQMVVA